MITRYFANIKNYYLFAIMKLEIERLRTFSNYAISRKVTRQHIYRLKEERSINTVQIDGVWFVLLTEKEHEHEKKNGSLLDFGYKKAGRPTKKEQERIKQLKEGIKTDPAPRAGIRKI